MIVQELRKISAPTSCAELKNQGITRNQEIYLDPDGRNFGNTPIQASCIFPQAEVSIGGNKKINISSCGDDSKCFRKKIIDDDNVLQQMINVMNSSPACSQTWEFESLTAPLKHPVSLKGRKKM